MGNGKGCVLNVPHCTLLNLLHGVFSDTCPISIVRYSTLQKCVISPFAGRWDAGVRMELPELLTYGDKGKEEDEIALLVVRDVNKERRDSMT